MDKMITPYAKGAKLTIYRHLAPEPTPLRYQHCGPEDFDELAKMTLIERCLKHPPLRGTTLWSRPFSITITDEITTRSTFGARLLGVNSNLVAKIYDPLYYPVATPSNDVGTNPFRLADHDYSYEVAAYERASGRLGGTVIPKYYGSFTCKLSVVTASGTTTRSIRLILIERILGTCMRDLEPRQNCIPQYQRQNIMAKIVDAESLLFFHGVLHRDMHPRNVMLCGVDLADANLRVVLIDLGSSSLINNNTVDDSGLPHSPLLRWDVRCEDHYDFKALGWIDWDWQAWLEERWSDSKAYAPITDASRDYWLGPFNIPPRSSDWRSQWNVLSEKY